MQSLVHIWKQLSNIYVLSSELMAGGYKHKK